MARTHIRAKTRNDADLKDYFEYSTYGIEVLQDGLVQMSFGEFLVEQKAISRFQLFRALQMQDRNPGVRLGECVAALGFASYSDVERHLERWNRLGVVEA